MATVSEMLEYKSSQVHTVGADQTVIEAIEAMNRHQIGSLVIVDAGRRVEGIFTERDVLRRVIGERRDPEQTRVGEVMTQRVVCCNPDTPINQVRTLMMERRIRHLPVVDGEGALAGMLSIGDLNAWSIRDGQVTIQYLQEYIHGRM